MFIQKMSELWACIALRMAPAMFFSWILCLILSQARISSSSRVLPFAPMGQTAISPQASHPTAQRDEVHQVKVTSFVAQQKHNLEGLYLLSKASALAMMPKVVVLWARSHVIWQKV